MSHTNKYLWGHTVLRQHNYFCCECVVKALKEIHSCAESQYRDSTVQESCCSFLHRIFVVYDPWAGVILPWVHKLSGKGICYVIFDIHHHMMHRKWQHNDFSHKNSSEKKSGFWAYWSKKNEIPKSYEEECVVLAVIAAHPGLPQFSNNLFGKNVFLKHYVLWLALGTLLCSSLLFYRSNLSPLKGFLKTESVCTIGTFLSGF